MRQGRRRAGAAMAVQDALCISCSGSYNTMPPFSRNGGSSVRGSRLDGRRTPAVAGMSGLRRGGAGSTSCSRPSEVVVRTSRRRKGRSRSMAVSTIDPDLTAIEYLREHACDQSIPAGVGAVHGWLAAHQGSDPLRMRQCRDRFFRTREKFPRKLWNFMFWMHILDVLHVFQSLLDLGFTADAAETELSASLSHGIVLDAWPPLPPYSEWEK